MRVYPSRMPMPIMPLVFSFATLAMGGSEPSNPTEPSPAAQADDAQTPADEAADRAIPRTLFTVRTGARYELEADVGDTGEIATTRLGLGASVSQALGDGQHRASLAIDAVWSNYDLALPAALSPTPGLFDDAIEADIRLGLGGKLNDDGWFYGVSGGVGFSGEPDADFGDALTWSAGGFVTKRVNDTLTLGLGLGVASRIEDDPIVFPLPIVKWAFADKWLLETDAGGGLISGGPGLALVHTPNDDWRFAARVSYVNRTYRLSDDAAISEGVFEQSAIPVTFEAVWTPSRSVELRLLAGIQFAGEVETRTRSGSEVGDESVDPQPFVGAELTFRF